VGCLFFFIRMCQVHHGFHEQGVVARSFYTLSKQFMIVAFLSKSKFLYDVLDSVNLWVLNLVYLHHYFIVGLSFSLIALLFFELVIKHLFLNIAHSSHVLRFWLDKLHDFVLRLADFSNERRLSG
jgi:hypothetical protein